MHVKSSGRAQHAFDKPITSRSSALDDLAIDIFSVPDLKDGDLLTGIVYEVDNTMVALADSIAVVISSEFLVRPHRHIVKSRSVGGALEATAKTPQLADQQLCKSAHR
jgi:hypothetical protein